MCVFRIFTSIVVVLLSVHCVHVFPQIALLQEILYQRGQLKDPLQEQASQETVSAGLNDQRENTS